MPRIRTATAVSATTTSAGNANAILLPILATERPLRTAGSRRLAGLVPRQHSSGGKARLLGISKRGDPNLRTLLIHGARSALRTAPGKERSLESLGAELAQCSHPNVAATALANKMARVAWAMLRHGTTYQPNGLAA